MTPNRTYGTGLAALLVDGDLDSRRVLEWMLESAGFEVEVAETLEGARERTSGSRFDLVVVEEVLPDGSGLDLGEPPEVQAGAAVVVTSAQPSVASASLALRRHAADYVAKPYDGLQALHERLAAVTRALVGRREREALVAELRSENSRLGDLVVRDGLTGLYNHAYFQERLAAEFARSHRGGHNLSLLFVDLDRFKAINDSVGHQAGDAILKKIGATLEGNSGRSAFSVREQDIAARWGGDELVLLLPETTKGGAAVTAERLRACVAAAGLGARGLRVTVSIGIASYPTDGYDSESLVRAADTALYAAKRLGGNRVVSYDAGLGGEESPAMPISVSHERLLALDRSLANRAFEFTYQPIVRTEGFRLFGYEELCRPKDGVLGGVSEAIAAAERTGKMLELGRILRELAIEPVTSLGEGETLFVNLHPHELGDPTLTLLDGLLRPWAPRLVLEISEAVAIEDYEMTRRIVRELHEVGFRIALDDLGAGYAGLHALAQLEADFVKLDRSLVKNLHHDSRASRLIKHLLEYAESEGITVVAEGIETRAEWDVMRGLGCPLVQGFFVGTPAPAFQPVMIPRTHAMAGPLDASACSVPG